MVYNAYGKRPLWQWILLYVIVGGVVYALIYYFFFAGKGGYFQPAPLTETPETFTEPSSEVEFNLEFANSPVLGEYLTAWNGLALYVSGDDEVGQSKCVGSCAANWPPYIVSRADSLKAGENISGEIGTIERDDGSLQVTYKGLPLYFWRNDQSPGDTTGHGLGSFSIAKP